MKPAVTSIRSRRADRRGVALVITLIMLAVVTVFAVAFLSVARRERVSVSVKQDLDDSRLANDAGVARAQAEILGRMIATTNFWDYDLINSYNQDGGAFFAQNASLFDAAAIAALTNDARPPVFVSLPGGALDFRFYLDLNRNGVYDTNFYNPTPLGGVVRYDLLGDPLWVGLLERPGEAHSRSNRFLGRYAYLALPVSKSLDVNFVFNNSKGVILGNGTPPPATADGFLRNHGYGNWEYNLAAFLHELNPVAGAWPGYSYSPAGPNAGNAFVSANDVLRFRYASNSFPLFSFTALHPVAAGDVRFDGIDAYADGPVIGGAGLDYDRQLPPPGNDNPLNAWPGSPGARTIRSFEEFVDVAVRARYPRFHDTLTNIMGAVNPPNGFDRTTLYRMLAQMGTDSPAGEPLRFLRSTNDFSGALDVVQLPGDTVAVVTNFVGHGYNPGEWIRVATGNPTNVFGTYRVVRTWVDSFWLDAFPLPVTPPTSYSFRRNNQIHLNYNNLTEVETNFVPWTPQGFFTNVADRLLRQWTNYGITLSLTNIPVYPTNYYTPRVHQLLQVAANLYDATSTNQFPSIFRPHFVKTPANEVYVSGYSLVVGTNLVDSFLNPRISLGRLANNPTIFPANYTNFVVFGVPPVVGAKKYLPNFNEFAMSTAMQAVRRLQVVRPATNQPPNETNQMFLLSLTNAFAAEFWHPYNRTYPNTVSTRFELTTEATLTNELGFFLRTNFAVITGQVLPPGTLPPYGFQLAVTNAIHPVLPLSVYFRATPPYAGSIAPNTFLELGSNGVPTTITNILFEKGVPLYEPRWSYAVTNQVFFAMVDEAHNRIIDLVALEGLSMRTNLNDILFSTNLNRGSIGVSVAGTAMRDFWAPGIYGTPGPSPGMLRQLSVSRSTIQFQGWNPFNAVNVQSNAAANFARFLTAPTVRASETNFQAPFTVGESLWFTYKWQVDDPLVHYVAENYSSPKDDGLSPDVERARFRAPAPPVFASMRQVNERYRPWGGYRVPTAALPMGGATFAAADDYAFLPNMKDPNVRVPDEWDFPTVFGERTNSYGNVGWIGRVHRGTPWQTVYLKAAEVNTNDWLAYRNTQDTYPTNDWSLVDLFTVHVDDNARRGLLSINQTNRAAWSAALAGMPVLVTNAAAFYSGAGTSAVPVMPDRFIAPNSPEFDAIYNGIQAWRNAQPRGVFTNLGSFLGAMELSAGNNTNSPFLPDLAVPLNVGPTITNWQFVAMTDAAVERIPQQLLSMVQLENPVRFAIYAWGQSLRPADRSLVTVPGPTFQLCTNYQITGEVVTKSVVRIEPRVITDWPGATNNVTNLNIVVESYEVLQNP